MAKKIGLVQRLGVPTEFGVLCLTLLLVAALVPYLAGQDLGLFKVPTVSPSATALLTWGGPVALIIGLLSFAPLLSDPAATEETAPHRLPPDRATPTGIRALESTSKYTLQNVGEIVKEEMKREAINIDPITIADRLNIADLEQLCARVWYPTCDSDALSVALHAARATAFSRKYAAPREDEKLVAPDSIQVVGLRPWQEYVREILAEQGITSLDALDVLSVGIGNGYAETALLSSLPSFKAVDVSAEALAFAKEKLPRMISWTGEAENLTSIENASIDVYLSFRVYQSTLFGRRAALHEAYRVLRSGGLILVSIPIMYIQKSGTVLSGLQPPGSRVPSMEYADKLVARIRDHMEILMFRAVTVDRRSPFEILVYARR